VRAGSEPPAGVDPPVLANLRHPSTGRRDEPRLPPWWHVVKPGRTAVQDRAERRSGADWAVRAVTDWVLDVFAGSSLRQIMLVHDVDNPASCRVAEKAGYPFRALSPANPPRWYEDGHIHMRQASAEHRCVSHSDKFIAEVDDHT